MADKTKEQLETELQFTQKLEAERKTSDDKYAIKLVERIVFGAIALIAIAVLTALISLVVRQ